MNVVKLQELTDEELIERLNEYDKFINKYNLEKQKFIHIIGNKDFIEELESRLKVCEHSLKIKYHKEK